MTNKKTKLDNEPEMTGKVVSQPATPAPQPTAQVVEEQPQPVSEKAEVDRSVLEEMQTQIKILTEASREDKLRMAQKKYGKEEEVLPTGFLKRVQGKLVLRWLSADESELVAKNGAIYDPRTNMQVGENLKGEYITLNEETGEEDKETLQIDAIKFYKSEKREKFERISEEIDSNGEVWWNVRFFEKKLPQNLKINVKYINP